MVNSFKKDSLPSAKARNSSLNPASNGNSTLNSGNVNKNRLGANQHEENGNNSSQTSNEKVMITGDDILIEYVQRLSSTLARYPEDQLNYSYVEKMEKFITHYVWH